MTAYRRAKVEGTSYFFTVTCAERRGNNLLVEHIGLLRQVFRKVKNNHPLNIDAIVILPDHCIVSGPCHRVTQIIRHAGQRGPIDAVRKLTTSYVLC